jgi:serine/threonine protein phosphatase 1
MLVEAIQPKKNGTRWVIGDVHGRFDLLQALLKKIHLTKNDALFLTGDYIDRGPNSKAVINLIMRLQNSHTVQPLLGNHELMLLMAYSDAEYHHTWKHSYGSETLSSFNVVHVREIDETYINWILSLPKVVISYATEPSKMPHVISHAGVDYQASDTFDDTPNNRMDVLFRCAASPDAQNRFRAVVGHTSRSLFECKNSAASSLIYVDAGCGKAKGRSLLAYNLDTDAMVSVKAGE